MSQQKLTGFFKNRGNVLKRQIENTKLSQIEAAVASKKQKTDPSSQSQGTMSPPKQWTSRRSSVADAADAPQFAHRVRTEKVMNDNIHGRITLPGVAVAFIDTPQFQRLRKLKQLGMCYYVYPGACHNRFEHSLGVAHLAGSLLKGILDRQPGLRASAVAEERGQGAFSVTQNDVHCVQLAGLLHDLGHGPFSHVFDNVLLKKIAPPGTKWTHEQAGCDLMSYMLESNNINLKDYGMDEERDLEFVKECIVGVDKEECAKRDKHDAWERPRFLYFIINNTESGLDVDKLDYYQRDCRGAGIKANDTFDELLDTAMVMRCSDGVSRLCFPEKYYESVYDAFHVRFQLHRKVYQHRVVKSIEYMLCDALEKAHDHIYLRGRKRILDSLDDPELYSRLNDSILDLIWNSNDEGLDEAKVILGRIERRDLYINLGSVPLPVGLEERLARAKKIGQEDQAVKDIVSEIAGNSGISADSLLLDLTTIHHGKKDGSNPVDEVYFFKKNTSCAATVSSEKYQSILPQRFVDKTMRVYCRNRALAPKASVAFRKWCSKRKAPSPVCSYSQDTSHFAPVQMSQQSYGSVDDENEDGSTDFSRSSSGNSGEGSAEGGIFLRPNLIVSPSKYDDVLA